MIITGINVSNGVALNSQFRAPEPPTIGVANVLSNNSVNISFTGPVLNGDSAIIGYTALSFPDNIKNEILDPNASNITITGLNDNTNYTFSVTANNSDGPSANSSSSNLILTDSYPPAPTISYVEITSSTSANIVYTAPAYNGNSTITSYTAVSNVGNVSATVSTANSGNITITGLANNITHGFSVYAVNQYGRGISSNLTNGFFIHATVYSAPDSPTISYAETRDGVSANIVYTAPAINGNSEIISYTATSIPGNVRATVNTANSGNISLGGLTRNTDYTFVVTATNAFGTSPNSSISNSIKTLAAPGAPTVSTWAKYGNIVDENTANIGYTAPSFTGSTPILSYTLVSVPENRTVTVLTADSGSILMPNLTNDTTYVFAVYATNSVGSSPLSIFSGPITFILPLTVPNPPTINYIRSGELFGQANLNFTGNAFTGRTPITSYTANANGLTYSTLTTNATTGNITLYNLTVGRHYTINLVATNAVGNSNSSLAVFHTPVGANTSIPTNLLLVAGGGGGSGGSYNDSNGGGGAGGLLYYGDETPKVPNGDSVGLQRANTYAITIGGGGAGYASGAASSIAGTSVSITASGGGRGGSGAGIASPGGSGGGSYGNGAGDASGANVTNQGFKGGAGDYIPGGGNAIGGGGGGAGGAGQDGGYFGAGGGSGGIGLRYNISGVGVDYAGGGGASGAGRTGIASSGGGAPEVNGTPNTGGGAGGGTGYWSGTPTNWTGGSGVAVVRYADSHPAAITTGNPNVSVSGGVRIYRYWQSGTINIPIPVYIPAGTPIVEFLAVAGGGGASGGIGGGGGGGGVVMAYTPYIQGTPYTVTVGGGGTSTAYSGFAPNGANSSVFGAIAIGGGGAGVHDSSDGAAGGSGGGGSSNNSRLNAGGAVIPSTVGPNSIGTTYGNRGGNLITARTGGPTKGAGGGGAGGVGRDTNPNTTGDEGILGGGAGGVGIQSDILGTSYYFAGGGGGGAHTSGCGGYGGLGGGGGGGGEGSPAHGAGGGSAINTGGNGGNPGGSGGTNTGGGGGSSYWQFTSGGAGGSGIVVLRYPDTYAVAAATTGSPNVTVSGGYRIYRFWQSGSITF